MIDKKTHEDSIYTLHNRIKNERKSVVDYIDFFFRFVQKNEIRLNIRDQPMITIGTVTASGVYSFETKELHLAVGKPIEQWFETLMHERCHAEQHASGTFSVKHDHDIEKFFSWVAKEIDLQQDAVNSLVENACEIESDCEIRVVKDVQRFELTDIIDPAIYSQKANSYVTFYKHIGKHRTWYVRPPYTLPEVWGQFPKSIIPNGCALTPELEKLLDLCIRGEST